MSTILLRTLIMYLVLIISMRLIGKRQLGQLELSEFVLASLSADIAVLPLQDDGVSVLRGILPLVLLTALEYSISYIAMKSPAFRAFLRGKPSILIEKGRIQPEALRRCRLSTDELREALREKGCLDLSTARCAVLETDGNLSLILFPAAAPPTAGAMGINPEPEGYPLPVISGGRILKKNLSALKMSPEELIKYLKAQGHSGPEGIFFMSLDEYGKAYISEEKE